MKPPAQKAAKRHLQAAGMAEPDGRRSAFPVVPVSVVIPRPPIDNPDRQETAAAARPEKAMRSGVVTGARIVLWLSAQSRPQVIPTVADRLGMDPKHCRRCLDQLAACGLIHKSIKVLRSGRSVPAFSLHGGSNVVGAPQHRDRSSGGHLGG